MRRTLFTDEQDDYRESFRRFLSEEVRPGYLEWERAGIVPRELYAKAAAMGFASMAVPERYGGPGIEDFRFNVVVAEELALAQVIGFGLGLTLHNDVCLPYLLSYATEEQRERWLPAVARCEQILAIAMTEPDTGSDLAGIRTTAIRSNGGYLVNGAKTFITNGINGDLVIVAVKTDPSERHRGVSLLVLDPRAAVALGHAHRREAHRRGFRVELARHDALAFPVHVVRAHLLGQEAPEALAIVVLLVGEQRPAHQPSCSSSTRRGDPVPPRILSGSATNTPVAGTSASPRSPSTIRIPRGRNHVS